MSLTISLPPDVERRISEEAEREGIPAVDLVRKTLEVRWATAPNPTEAALLARINEGFPAEFWERYQTLRPRIRETVASESERTEFLEMAERVERRQTERLGALVGLARLRGEDLDATISSLGLEPEE